MLANPGRVITSNKLASLVTEEWPQSHTPLNVMSRFKKSGNFPLNPSEVTDRQIAPSKLFQQQSTKRPDDLYHMSNYYGNLYRVELSL